MTEDGVNGIMGSKARVRLLSDTGSTTGVATVILALLSAGTVATITLVGAHQLAPAVSERLRAGEPSEVREPAKVVVTPRAAGPSLIPARESSSHRHSSKRQASSASVVASGPAVVTSPATRVPTHTPRVTLPRVHVDRPTVTPPTVTVPAVTVPTATVPAVTTPAVVSPPVAAPPAPGLSPGPTVVNAPPVPGYPNVASTGPHRSSGLDAYSPPQQAGVAVLAEKRSSSRADGGACGVRAGGDRAGGERRDDGYGDDRRRGHGSGDSRHDRRDR